MGMGINYLGSEKSRIWPPVASVSEATKVSDVGFGQPLVSDEPGKQKWRLSTLGLDINYLVSKESRIWPLVASVWAATKVSDVG